MKIKEITFNGKSYPVVINMSAMLAFERLMGKPFLGNTFDLMEDRIALIAAAVFGANADTDFKAEDMMNADDYTKVKEIIDAFDIVLALTLEFFKVPAIEQEGSQKTEDEGKSEKNTKSKN